MKLFACARGRVLACLRARHGHVGRRSVIMKIANPYHPGELEIQERVGVLQEGAQNARVIQDSIIKGALRFINQQSMTVLSSLDDEENVWASVMFGKPGFMRAEDEQNVMFDLTSTVRNAHDPFWKHIQLNPEVGMLVIELASRRRPADQRDDRV